MPFGVGEQFLSFADSCQLRVEVTVESRHLNVLFKLLNGFKKQVIVRGISIAIMTSVKRVAVVTGANKGIGLSIVKHLLNRCFPVCCS